ncbi:hypothetical protein E3N88_13896 [Mikania micrantha]|uniref:Uncharacterized protein n=1 Tax=Mikania micrantha TaxID=192012 RepID=A0A5N6P2I5_9ASTR|nr:hypothetical protein E3N88_13896 [Mikania micrantha]
MYLSDENYTLFTQPPPPPSAKTISPIEVSRDTMEEVTVSDDKDINENYGSNLEEPPGSLVEDGAGQGYSISNDMEDDASRA